MITGTFAY